MVLIEGSKYTAACGTQVFPPLILIAVLLRNDLSVVVHMELH